MRELEELLPKLGSLRSKVKAAEVCGTIDRATVDDLRSMVVLLLDAGASSFTVFETRTLLERAVQISMRQQG